MSPIGCNPPPDSPGKLASQLIPGTNSDPPPKPPLLRKDGTPRNKPGPKPKPKVFKPRGKPGPKPKPKGRIGGGTRRGIPPESRPSSPSNSPNNSRENSPSSSPEITVFCEAQPDPGPRSAGRPRREFTQREKDQFLGYLKVVGRATACELADVTYDRFVREMREDREFGLAVRSTEMQKDEMVEAPLYRMAVDGHLPAIALWLNHRRAGKQLTMNSLTARQQQKLAKIMVARAEKQDGGLAPAVVNDFSRLNMDEMLMLESLLIKAAGGPPT